jgi:acetylornithine deacetylase
MEGDIFVQLERLVAIDSQNPPRRSAPIVEYLSGLLRDRFTVDVRDLGDGSVSILATRGAPKVLFNFHVDTVPAAAGWTKTDPLRVTRDGEGRAFGLGTADTKGAAAAMLTVALKSDADCALLFTTDEEAGQATCVRDFCARKPAFEIVIVAEPTSVKAVFEHRGVATGTISFRGRATHSSAASSESATHALVRWGAAALDAAGPDARFNVGVVSGGVKPNVVAAEAEARFGVRPPAARDPKMVLAELAALAPSATFAPGFFGPPLRETPAARRFADAHEIPAGPAVDFWTEASLFAQAGYPTFVFGAGSIAQAHGADEFVPMAELVELARIYQRILSSGGQSK